MRCAKMGQEYVAVVWGRQGEGSRRAGLTIAGGYGSSVSQGQHVVDCCEEACVFVHACKDTATRIYGCRFGVRSPQKSTSEAGRDASG